MTQTLTQCTQRQYCVFQTKKLELTSTVVKPSGGTQFLGKFGNLGCLSRFWRGDGMSPVGRAQMPKDYGSSTSCLKQIIKTGTEKYSNIVPRLPSALVWSWKNSAQVMPLGFLACHCENPSAKRRIYHPCTQSNQQNMDMSSANLKKLLAYQTTMLQGKGEKEGFFV